MNAQIKFDSTGQMILLYRDKFKLNPKGNWHLVRLSGPVSAGLGRKEIDFSIPQEPVDPDSTRRWDTFSSSLLLSPDGSRAYATFQGSVVSEKPGPPPPGAVRHVNVESFSSVISFDLNGLRVLATSNLLPPRNNFVGQETSATGDLLLLYLSDTDWTIAILDGALHEVGRQTINAAPIEKTQRSACYLRPNLQIQCPMPSKGDMRLALQSVLELPPSNCKVSQEFRPVEIGKNEVRDTAYILLSDRLCTRDDSGNRVLFSADLLPRCPQGWIVSAVSPDGHSALTTCIMTELYLDTFSRVTRADLQVINLGTMSARTTIPLSKRRRTAFAVFHNSGMSKVAVLEDGNKLLLYSAAD